MATRSSENTIVDFRCPVCNRCVDGKGSDRDVRTLQKLPPKECVCEFCKASVTLLADKDPFMGTTYFYTEKAEG